MKFTIGPSSRASDRPYSSIWIRTLARIWDLRVSDARGIAARKLALNHHWQNKNCSARARATVFLYAAVLLSRTKYSHAPLTVILLVILSWLLCYQVTGPSALRHWHGDHGGCVIGFVFHRIKTQRWVNSKQFVPNNESSPMILPYVDRNSSDWLKSLIKPWIVLIWNIQPPQYIPPSPRHHFLAALGRRFWYQMTILKVHWLKTWAKSKHIVGTGGNILEEACVRTSFAQ